MELTDAELGLIHTWVWDGLEEAGGGPGFFFGMTVDVDTTHLNETQELGVVGQDVIVVSLFWDHAANPTGKTVSGKYMVTEEQWSLIAKDNQSTVWRDLGAHLARDVIKMLQAEGVEE